MKIAANKKRSLALAVSTTVAFFASPLVATNARAADLPTLNAVALFNGQKEAGNTGLARKTKSVDVRAANPGEVIVTIIKGQGKETQSPPAAEGDMVVRNRCEETGNEEILIPAKKFAPRYEGPLGDGSLPGWQTYRPRGKMMGYFIVPESVGAFQFEAPWGEMMKAQPGDAIVQDPQDASDTYRVAEAAFKCTYEVVEPAR
jgi:hypothetical protein